MTFIKHCAMVLVTLLAPTNPRVSVGIHNPNS